MKNQKNRKKILANRKKRLFVLLKRSKSTNDKISVRVFSPTSPEIYVPFLFLPLFLTKKK